MTLPAHEIERRMRPLHPTARRQLARMTDTTYRGPHNIRDEVPYLLGLHPLVWIIPSLLALFLLLADPLGAL